MDIPAHSAPVASRENKSRRYLVRFVGHVVGNVAEGQLLAEVVGRRGPALGKFVGGDDV